MPFFDLIHKNKHTRARTGIIHTGHGDIETPAFMPVGTQASVKTLDQTDLETLGAQIILSNTYHLHLRPGEEAIAEVGGLHKFMNWNKPILTDSGGFQVFSLGLQNKNNDKNDETIAQSKLAVIDEDGVTFRSHIDGSAHRLTPESSIEIQHKLGADIIMAFDECTPDEADYGYARQALERTHRWAEWCLRYHKAHPVIPAKAGIQTTGDMDPRLHGDDSKWYPQFLFGIIQGARHKDLREESAKFISNLDFDGIAVGGESIGYNMEATKEILDWVYPIIPENKPHYAMGLGLSPIDLFEVVERGVDMFDCVAPTRLARHGVLYINSNIIRDDPKLNSRNRLNITNSQCARDTRPIDELCNCLTCQKYSRAYIHHLFNAHEISAMRLATIHNVYFFLDLMKQMREAIKEDRFKELKEKWTNYQQTN